MDYEMEPCIKCGNTSLRIVVSPKVKLVAECSRCGISCSDEESIKSPTVIKAITKQLLHWSESMKLAREFPDEVEYKETTNYNTTLQ